MKKSTPVGNFLYQYFFLNAGHTVSVPWGEIIGIKLPQPAVSEPAESDGRRADVKSFNVDNRYIDFWKSERYVLSSCDVAVTPGSIGKGAEYAAVAPSNTASTPNPNNRESCTNRLDVFYAAQRSSSGWAVARFVLLHASSSVIVSLGNFMQQMLSSKFDFI
jgi:hypothetical protein